MKIVNILSITLAIVAVIVIGTKYSVAKLDNPQSLSLRWLWSTSGGDAIASISSTHTANLVSTTYFEVPQPAMVDTICYTVGSASAGNVRVAIYGPIVTEEDVTGSPLAVQSASAAQPAANSNHCLSVATTSLAAGRYYFAYQGDNTGGSFMRHPSLFMVDGMTKTFSMAYGSFPSVATTSASAALNIPAMRARIVGR